MKFAQKENLKFGQQSNHRMLNDLKRHHCMCEEEPQLEKVYECNENFEHVLKEEPKRVSSATHVSAATHVTATHVCSREDLNRIIKRKKW